MKIKLFNKNEIKNKFRLKYGTYNLAVIAAVLAAVVLLNILATALCKRFPLSVDLSSTKQNTVTDENTDYIKQIDKDVDIILCATEDGYTGGYMDAFAQQNYMAQDTTGGYYRQTINLLKLYEKHNKKLHFSFSDPDAASFVAVQKLVPDTTLKYGDILVACTFKNSDGEEITNTRVLSYDDLYVLSDETGYAAYGYGSYTVGGSNVETAVTSALYSVTNETQPKAVLLSGHSTEGAFDSLSANLELNNYEITEISDAIITEIPEDASFVVIAGATADFAESELKLLDNFLENDGKKGKNLVVFCTPDSGNLPNLYAFLKEWGVSCEADSVLFETDENNFLTGDPLTMGFINAESEFTKAVNGAKDTIYIGGNNVPLSAAYTTFENRTTNIVLSSMDSVLSVPTSVYTSGWTPTDEYVKQQYAGAILTTDTSYDEDMNTLQSSVLVFSGTDFFSSMWSQYSAVGNNGLALALFNNLCGKDSENISFLSKTVSSFLFTAPSEKADKLVKNIFIIMIPVLVIVAGVFVWIRRKNK